MGRAAAFLDLDRTLLAGASGPVFSEALRTAGVLTRPSFPGERALYGVYDLVGETVTSMVLARQAAGYAKGWDRSAVREAAEGAADVLAAAVQPYARPLLEQHRTGSRPLVLATTSPRDLVTPLAERLGFDDVIATTYGEDDEGRYDGTVVGPFVWGPGKLRAVREWAAAHDVSVEDSWAYSDSVFDVPLLSAVGHPTAVNPDVRLRTVAAVRRWPVLHLDVPPGVPKVAGLVEPQRVALTFARPELIPYARFDIAGTQRIPAEGPAILVANHRSYFDPAAVGLTVARTGRTVRFLGKKEVFDAPVVGQLARAFGGIRVVRGSGSDEPLREAALALEAGEVVAIMPQGTIPRGEAFFEPELQGRWGAARLAGMTGAPVVPLGLWGTERVWPRSSRVPLVWNVVRPPVVTVRVGEPFTLDGDDVEADTRTLMARIVELLPAEARQRREPTPEELARTMPPGWRPEGATSGPSGGSDPAGGEGLA